MLALAFRLVVILSVLLLALCTLAVAAGNGNRQLLIASATRGEIFLTDVAREHTVLLIEDGDVRFPLWSPEGDRLSFHRFSEGGIACQNYILQINNGVAYCLPEQAGELPIFAWSPDGTQVMFLVEQDETATIYIARADGSGIRQITGDQYSVFDAAWSPDGGQLAFEAADNTHADSTDIYIVDVNSGRLQNLTNNPSFDGWPAWSPDGTQIAFISSRAGAPNLYLIDRSGANARRLTFEGEQRRPVWSPEGQRIVFENYLGADQYDIYVIDADGGNLQNLTSDHSGVASSPAWSPDGTQIVFLSLLDGYHIAVMDANGRNTRLIADGGEGGFSIRPR